jgi:tetratricopeptide (TPR) repeat protein
MVRIFPVCITILLALLILDQTMVAVVRAEDKCAEATQLVNQAIALADGSKKEQELYLKAIEICPQLAEAHHNLAVSYVENGRLMEARNEIQKALALSDTPDIRLGLAHVLLLLGDLEDSKKEYQMVLNVAPQNEKALQGLSYIELEKGQEHASIELLEKALEKNPVSEVSLYNRAILAERMDNKEVAERFYRELLKVQPSHEQGVIRLCLLLSKSEQVAEVKNVLEKAVRANSENTTLLLLLATTSEELGDLDDAEVTYKKIIARNPKDEEALTSLASLYLAKRQHQLTIETLEKLFAINTDSVKGLTVQGVAYVQLGKFEEARKSLERAIKVDPTQAVAHYNLSLVQRYAGEDELASESLKRAKVLDPSIVD